MNSPPFDGPRQESGELPGESPRPYGKGWAGLRTTGPGVARHTVWVRFTLSDLPGVTSRPPRRTAAVKVAGRVLLRHGHSYRGGDLEVVWDGSPDSRSLTLAECCTTARAVENVLAAGRGALPPAHAGDHN